MKKKIRSAFPVYFSALVWLVYGMLFPLYTLRHILTAASFSIAVYIITSYIFPGRVITVEPKFETGDTELDAQLTEARSVLKRLHEDNERIPDKAITEKLNKLEEIGEKILARVQERPNEGQNVRKFMSYYLPAAEKLLNAYSRLQHTGESDTVSRMLTNIENSLGMIVTAFEKQLDSLYKEEYLDITTDIEVLETMMKSDGLLETPLN